MDKIRIENPSKSEVIARCGGMKKPNNLAEQSNAKQIKQDVTQLISLLHLIWFVLFIMGEKRQYAQCTTFIYQTQTCYSLG